MRTGVISPDTTRNNSFRAAHTADMNTLSLMSAVLISVISPVTLPDLTGIKDGCAVFVEDQAIVAVIPEPHVGLEAKSETMRRTAETLGENWGREVIVTEDMLTYLVLLRIGKRGADDYERRNLAARLARIKTYCYLTEKAG